MFAHALGYAIVMAVLWLLRPFLPWGDPTNFIITVIVPTIGFVIGGWLAKTARRRSEKQSADEAADAAVEAVKRHLTQRL